MFKVLLHKEAVKDYKRYDPRIKARLDKAFESLKTNPFYGSQIRRLTGKLSHLYRYRIGGLRIIYEIHKELKTVQIKVIESRGDAY